MGFLSGGNPYKKLQYNINYNYYYCHAFLFASDSFIAQMKSSFIHCMGPSSMVTGAKLLLKDVRAKILLW